MNGKLSNIPKNIRFSNYILDLANQYLREHKELTFSELVRVSLQSFLYKKMSRQQ